MTNDGGTNWVSAPTGGFTIAQIEAGHVRFAQDGSPTVPDFSIHVSDGSHASPDIAPDVSLGISGANSQTITFAGSQRYASARQSLKFHRHDRRHRR